MANINGTNLAASVVPFTTEDQYATHQAKYGQGGWQEVATISDRDAITAARREAGMAVYVLATNKVYILGNDLTTWTELESGKVDDVKINNVSIVTNKVANITVEDTLSSTSTTNPLSANQGKVLQDEIEALSGRGRFLSVWNCATGLPETNPQQSPYEYHNGDYFIVGTVAASGGTNYKPDGSSYTIGVASTTVETESVEINDTYIYDGTVWHLQQNAQREVSFSSIAGSPYDNTNLASALNNKADATDIGNAVLTIQKNSTQVGTFTANSKTDTTINISVPTKTSDITNDSGYITAPTITYNAQTEELTIS